VTDINTQHPLDLEAARLSVKKPGVRHDKQGETPDDQRVAAAMRNFVKDFSRPVATYMESCIHCGQCAQACHFYAVTGDPKYTPIWKLEPFKQAYKREAGPFARVYKAFNLKSEVTLGQLEEWQELLYDSCTMCGRCTLICPMGIDIAALVGLARHAMFHAGLVPHELWAVAERAKREGSPLGATPKLLKERLEWLADEHDIGIPLDQPRAEILVTLSSIEIMKYPQSIVALAKILQHMGVDWTLRSDGFEATNFGMLSGNMQWQKESTMKLINAAIACGAQTVVMPECGHAYGAMRWQGANMYGKPLPFRALHVSEFLAAGVASGKLRLKKLDQSLTFHDPCQVSRRGGATQAPRQVLRALGVDLREPASGGDLNWCCGGGGGVVAIHRADPLRHKAFEIKMQQIDATGAAMAVTSCANCRQSFDDGQAHFKWERTMGSLVELVADNLAADAA
jgi:Fe-S oxidoreductase